MFLLKPHYLRLIYLLFSFPLLSTVKNECSLTDEEVVRTAMRIATSSWAQLQIASETMSEVDVLKKYITLCPHVPSDSPVVAAALEGLERYSNLGTSNGQTQLFPSQPLPDVAASTREGDTSSQNPTISLVATKEIKSSRRGLRAMGYILRALFLDVPLILLLALYVSFCWVHHVRDLYLKPQMDAMVWTPERAEKEITYYQRFCDASDMTTQNPVDLLLPDDATVEDAYQHQLVHGLTVFSRVLSDETATTLRDMVISRNKNLTEKDSIFVLSNMNRFSFGLDTEEPSVVQALKELTHHELLVQVLEKVLGPNPALIEMTAITAEYGAVPQRWHEDVIPTASALQYGRSFGPSYTIFIALQNTTKHMGATSVCPGTFMCPFGDMDKFCEELGFQLVDSDGHWRAGDALLMNMNSQHRGAGHTDPDGQDRVLFILTFCPKPLPRAESRQMSNGITFSLRWDLWGHTLHDFAHADVSMKWPWTILRSLGIYKQRGAEWGLDYITSSSMRIANNDHGFRRDQLAKFIERGGINWLPTFLQGDVNDNDSWGEYLWSTFLKCKMFLSAIYLCALGAYVGFGTIAIVISEIKDGKIAVASLFPRFGIALRRLLLIHIIFCGCYLAANYHVDHTGWAKDIRAGRLYTNAFAQEDENEAKSVRLYSNPFLKDEKLLKELKSTFPHRRDVLIENRYSSRHFGLYNDFVSAHPGNRLFNALVDSVAQTFRDYPGMFRQATARFIVSTIESEQGRFLYQDWEPSWRLLSNSDAVEYATFVLSTNTNSVLRRVAKEIYFLVSDCKFGVHRRTVLSHKHSILFLKRLLLVVADATDVNMEKPIIPYGAAQITSWRTFSLPLLPSKAKYIRRSVNLRVGGGVNPPDSKAWFTEGDVVDVSFQLGDDVSRWFQATILLITSSGSFHVQYLDGQTTISELKNLRPFVSYVGDTTLEVLHDSIWYPGVVVAEHDDRSYDVVVQDLNLTLEKISPRLFRRRPT